MPEKHYDLIVIGSGPAGEKGAVQAASFGKRVAIVEKEAVLGGAVANTGTHPSKTLRETALYLSGYHQRELYGVRFALKEKVTVRDFLFRERIVTETERERVMENLKRHQVHVYMGAASFVDVHTISIKPDKSPALEIQGDVILIATGSNPYRPTLLPFYDPRVYDSDTILTLHEMPPTMLVVGGGVIGCEYACMFAALGIKVTLVEGHDRLLGFLDHEVSDSLKTRMQSIGIDIRMPDAVERVDAEDLESLKVKLQSGAVLETHTVLESTGRNGCTEGLGLERVGITPDARGHVAVNEHCQTCVPNVYAAGDVIGFPALAATSMEQARVAMVHAFDLRYKTEMASVLPIGIYTIPECSMVGETEESAQEKKIPYVAGKVTYGQNARGQIIGETEGFLKLLFREEDMRLIGAHIIGEQATEIIHVGLTALLTGADADLFLQACYNYPTLSGMYKYATYDALGRQQARPKAN